MDVKLLASTEAAPTHAIDLPSERKLRVLEQDGASTGEVEMMGIATAKATYYVDGAQLILADPEQV